MGVFEFWINKGNVIMEIMFLDFDCVFGDFGFDFMGFVVGKSQEEKDVMALKELKNGCFVMFVIGGMIYYNWVIGEFFFLYILYIEFLQIEDMFAYSF